MENRIQILSTRPIQQSLIKDARDAGIDIDELTFIETNPIQSKLVDKEIENTLKETATVVFTSMNAVEVVGNQINLFFQQ
jgi:uroporphyrinogen-III synthase